MVATRSGSFQTGKVGMISIPTPRVIDASNQDRADHDREAAICKVAISCQRGYYNDLPVERKIENNAVKKILDL